MIEVHCERNSPGSDNIGVWLFDRTIGPHGAYAECLTMRTREDAGAYTPPAFNLSYTQAQQFVDELWRCGLRPSEGSGSAGSLLATQQHLTDMQKIAFGLLKKDGVDL